MSKEKPVGAKIGWELLGTHWYFKTKWLSARRDRVRLPNGSEREYTYVEHAGAVFVLPITPAGKIILLHLYRYTIDEWSWELVAGGMGDKEEASQEKVAEEEVAEEIGGTIGRLEHIGDFHRADGIANIMGHYFIAHDVKLDNKPKPEEMEIIDQIKEFSFDEVLAMIKKGEIKDDDTVLGILLAKEIMSIK